MTSISKTKPCRAILMAFDPKGSKSHMSSILAPWWPKFSLEAVEARGYSSVPNQCQDWEKFQRQKRVSPKTGDLPLTLPLIWQWREVSIKSETKSEANFQFIFCLWFGTYLELITLSAKSVANSETNFQSWDWTFIASEIHASLGTDFASHSPMGVSIYVEANFQWVFLFKTSLITDI